MGLNQGVNGMCVASPLNHTHNHSFTSQLLLNKTDPALQHNHSFLNTSIPPNVPHIKSGNYSIFFLHTITMVAFTTFLIFLYKRYQLQRTHRRIIYRLKVFLSLNPFAKPIVLLFATTLLIILGALLLYVEGNAGFGDALWLSTMIVADALNLETLVGTASRAASVTIRSAGIVIYACILGVVSETISSLFDSLRKGKSEVMEINHTLVLGWSEKLGSLLKQIALENQSVGGGVIVVLADRDKEEMEADIAKLECDYLGSFVTCRSGNPLILGDLQKVAVSNASAIIILASHDHAEQSVAIALRIVVCLKGLIGELTGRIIVEINDPKKEGIFKFVGGDILKTVVVPNVTARLMVQCALQPGLAKIWHDILGIDNQKFYVRSWPILNGRSFHDVLFLFPRALPCGVTVATNGGRMMLNPDDTYIFKNGDGVVVIADDANYGVDLSIEPPSATMRQKRQPWRDKKNILFCGWRPHIHDMISVMDALVPRGSELWLFNEFGEEKSKSLLMDDGLNLSNLENLKLMFKVGSTINRSHLENLPLESFHSIFILADKSVEDSIVHLDSRSLTTLLLIREIKGNEICLRPASLYLEDQNKAENFSKIMAYARQRQEIAIGYRLPGANQVIVNPPDKQMPIHWYQPQLSDGAILVISRKSQSAILVGNRFW